MAFERLTIAVGKAKQPAGLSISARGNTVVAVSAELIKQAGFKANASFAVLLGTEDDAGKLRIVHDPDGVPCAREFKRTGAFFFKLGMVPAIGTLQRKQQRTGARLVDGAIEIDIPPDDGPKLLPAPSARSEASSQAPRAPAAGPPKSAATRTTAGQTIGDVVINAAEDQESITFKGKSLAVSAREAKFLTILAKPRPNPVGTGFITDKLWDGRPPASAHVMLGQLVTDLKKSLPSIGLTVALVKGVGYQLKDNV
ncbi:helix-turn-helix domain-containing protein [Bradyrhizobium yuanmingense]|uniref:helix-turn-helix domain-containing protein n=1 Tax=Bradyrhizobium yuanmingense TaxID=108015 RepID=UPI000FE37A34|nr:helix-turn-helix domain-containing protein [Bradyrhizobium yuanmingense]TGN90898.1 helix-turn-helix domain-containing protein [Bradyrhizobium yuanmingense]